MNNTDKCRSNDNSNNVILPGHYRFLQALHESSLNVSTNYSKKTLFCLIENILKCVYITNLNKMLHQF